MDQKVGMVTFSQVIAENYKQLTKSEKRIAEFISKRQDEAGFLSAADIAERLGLSDATMVRFARKLGFESYPALRETLQSTILRRVSHSARLRSRLNDLREAGDIFERLVASEIDYLTESIQTLSRDDLQEAVKLLQNHKRIFVFGLGPSVSLVDLLEIRLTRFGKFVIPLKTSGKEMLEPMLNMEPSDLLVAIGFFDLTPNLKTVIDHANQIKAPVILMTDTLGNLIGDKADIVLAARRGPVSAFHSLTVPMTILNAILLALSSADEGQVMTHLDDLDKLREKLRKSNGVF